MTRSQSRTIRSATAHTKSCSCFQFYQASLYQAQSNPFSKLADFGICWILTFGLNWNLMWLVTWKIMQNAVWFFRFCEPHKLISIDYNQIKIVKFKTFLTSFRINYSLISKINNFPRFDHLSLYSKIEKSSITAWLIKTSLVLIFIT